MEPVEKNSEVESIQIWKSQKAPECYRRLFPAVSDIDWIAVVQPSAIHEFRQHLTANGYLLGINVARHTLADGTWMFGGRERQELDETRDPDNW